MNEHLEDIRNDIEGLKISRFSTINILFTLIVTIVPIIAILWLLKVVEILKFEEIEPFKPVARMFLFRGFLPLIGLTTIFDLVKYYIEKRDQRKLLSEANKIIKE